MINQYLYSPQKRNRPTYGNNGNVLATTQTGRILSDQ